MRTSPSGQGFPYDEQTNPEAVPYALPMRMMFLRLRASARTEFLLKASFSGFAVLKKYLSKHATSSLTLRIWCVILRGLCGSPVNTTYFTVLSKNSRARKYDQLCAGGTLRSALP